MKRKCKIESSFYKGDGVIIKNKDDFFIEYKVGKTKIFSTLFLVTLVVAVYFLLTSGFGDFFRTIAIFLFVYVIFSSIEATKDMFGNYEKININKKIIYSERFSTSEQSTSSSRVAARLGAAAFAGSLRGQGNRAGSNFWLGVAALTPSSKKTNKYGVNMILVDGTPMLIDCDKKTANLLSESTRNIEINDIEFFVKYYNDMKESPDKAIAEINKSLNLLGSKIKKLKLESSNGNNVDQRTKARKLHGRAIQLENLFQRLLEHKK